jgi:hypothetical protein
VDLQDPANLAFDQIRRAADMIDTLPPSVLKTPAHRRRGVHRVPLHPTHARTGSRQLVVDLDD